MTTTPLEWAALVAVLLGLLPAVVAERKGRIFWRWWVYGSLLFIVAIIHALVIPKPETIKRAELADEGYVACPWCAEMVRSEAIVCRYCGRDLVGVHR